MRGGDAPGGRRVRSGAELLQSGAVSECPSRRGQVGTERGPHLGGTDLSVYGARWRYLLVAPDPIECSSLVVYFASVYSAISCKLLRW